MIEIHLIMITIGLVMIYSQIKYKEIQIKETKE